MPSWFSKVFKIADTAPQVVLSERPAPPDLTQENEPAVPEIPARRILRAPVSVAPDMPGSNGGEIRIKARLNRGAASCTFLVDRPVLKGLSFVCPDRDTAHRYAPLAAELFDLGGIDRVVLHGMTITVSGGLDSEERWEQYAQEAGPVIREHLRAGRAAVFSEILERIPPEDTIRASLQRIIDVEINPGVAAHSGRIELGRVEGNTVYITMGGGCQGCAMSSVTLRQGIETAFRDALPYLGAILDETDHDAGTNPFFKEMPVEIG